MFQCGIRQPRHKYYSRLYLCMDPIHRIKQYNNLKPYSHIIKCRHNANNNNLHVKCYNYGYGL